MENYIVIEGNAFYEIDEECMREKEREEYSQKKEKRTEGFSGKEEKKRHKFS